MRSDWVFVFASFLAVPGIVGAATNPAIDRTEGMSVDSFRAKDLPVQVIPEDFATPEEAAQIKKRKRESDAAIWVVEDRSHKPPDHGDLLGVVQGDWNNDGFRDFAVLSAPSDQYSATLSIYEGGKYGPLSKVAEIAGTFGPHASISARSETAFSVYEVQLTGRHDWSKKVVIAFRDHEYVIAGIEVWAADSKEPGNENRCDWNLRTGQIIEETDLDSGYPNKSSNRISAWHADLTEYFEVSARIYNLCDGMY